MTGNREKITNKKNISKPKREIWIHVNAECLVNLLN